MKRLLKIVKLITVFSIIVCIAFSLSNCSKFPRRSPYTKVEIEKYLEETYGEEFSVISREEIYDSYTGALKYIDYEVRQDDTEIVFNARDMYDGAFAGYGVYDDFEEVVCTDND